MKGRAAAEASGLSCSPGEAELFVSEGLHGSLMSP